MLNANKYIAGEIKDVNKPSALQVL